MRDAYDLWDYADFGKAWNDWLAQLLSGCLRRARRKSRRQARPA
jgi:hypothetical protein